MTNDTTHLLEAIDHLRELVVAGKVHSAFLSWYEPVPDCPLGCAEHIAGTMRCRPNLRLQLSAYLSHEAAKIVLEYAFDEKPPSPMPAAGHA